MKPLIVWMALCGLLPGCATNPSKQGNSPRADLTGAWRSKIQFAGGAFASVKDLEFFYVFNQGGTLTESSNYDGTPPVPPAYGVWRRTGSNQYEAKYHFFVTRPPTSFEEIAKGGGWLPDGEGILVEQIILSADGNSFRSKISFKTLDRAGKPSEGGGDGVGEAVRISLDR